jgi:hypothetical protein
MKSEYSRQPPIPKALKQDTRISRTEASPPGSSKPVTELGVYKQLSSYDLAIQVYEFISPIQSDPYSHLHSNVFMYPV